MLFCVNFFAFFCFAVTWNRNFLGGLGMVFDGHRWQWFWGQRQFYDYVEKLLPATKESFQIHSWGFTWIKYCNKLTFGRFSLSFVTDFADFYLPKYLRPPISSTLGSIYSIIKILKIFRVVKTSFLSTFLVKCFDPIFTAALKSMTLGFSAFYWPEALRYSSPIF